MKSWSLNNLDRKLNKYLKTKNGYFIELGANDGISQSNTMYLEKYLGWNGLLIEPHLPNFEKLTRNRSPQNQYCNCACVAFDYKNINYRYVYSNLMTIGIDDENEIEDRIAHAEKGSIYLERGEINKTLTSKARTLDSVLREFNSPNFIDFMSLDVEGAELSVLRGIDHARFTFGFILLESRKINPIKIYLESKDYKFVKRLSDHDYLFKYAGGNNGM
jgi:FkbM family methyltransferase